MKIPLVGPSYQERSIPFDGQRCINLYPVFDENGKEVSALYGTPGLNLFSTCGAGPGRGGFTAANGRAFVVANSGLYEITSTGTATLRGTLDSSSGIVTMDENGLQLGICDGTFAYTFTYASNAFAKVTDVDLPSSVGTITFIDGYFVVNKNSSGAFYISSQYDGTAWAALDFATAESSPDDLKRVINAVGQLWLFGTKTTEIWTNTGASSFPFERISGAKMEVGIMSPHTAVALDNSVFWVGKDDNGQGVVYRAQGFSPQRISTHAIELKLKEVTNSDTLRAYTYQQDGHTFYVITGGGLDTSLVYDLATQLWHERAYLNASGEFESHLVAHGFYAFGKHLGISRLNGKVYEVSQDFYTDDGDEIASERTFTHLSTENQRQVLRELELAMETGVSNSAMLEISSQYILSAQTVTITIPASATSATASIATVSARATVFFGGFATDATSAREGFARVELTDTQTVTAYRNTSASSTVTVRATIIDWSADAVTSVTSGTLSIGAGNTQGSTTVATFDTASATVLWLGLTSTSTGTTPNNTYGRVFLSGTTSVEARRENSSDGMALGFMVVRFNPDIISSIQHGTVTGSGASTSDTATITSVDTSRSLLLYHGTSSASTTFQSATFSVEFTNATTITHTRTGTASTTSNSSFTVIEFAEGVVQSVQNGTKSLSSVASGVSSITPVDTTNAIAVYRGFRTNSASGAYSDQRPTIQLTNSGTVTSAKMSAGSAATTTSWGVIEFAEVTEEREPVAMLSISRDMGRTWSPPRSAGFGKTGEYKKRVIWRKLGQAFNLTFRVRITDPVKRVLIGSYLR